MSAYTPTGPGARPEPGGETGADPVKALMETHHDLCARAVDPLEIAAGLEARGVTDRTARHYLHRDVFALAEEMFARVPRHTDRARAELLTDRAPFTAAPVTGHRGPGALLVPLPGALALGILLALPHTGGHPRAALLGTGLLALALSLRACLRHGPLGSRVPAAPGTTLYVLLLLAGVLYGDGLLSQALSGGPDHGWSPHTAPALALLCALVPGALCARAFAYGARRRLALSRSLDDFVLAVRPLLLGTFLLFLCCLWTLLGLSAAALHQASGGLCAGALGGLLLLARLMIQYGCARAARTALLTACGLQFAALAAVFTARLPGARSVSAPVEALTALGGTGAVPALACVLTVLTLLARGLPVLSRASAHAARAGLT
ncbi:hypothetical protein [Streptomyces sp. NPDC007088]|uniref:hypothetical protein n=1 Tax=Streptomyces sp. NPDC007088 TaxID=3364773 RepID=UPI003687A766